MVNEPPASKPVGINNQIILIEVLTGLAISFLSLGAQVIAEDKQAPMFFSSLIGVILVGMGFYNIAKSDRFGAVFIYVFFALLFAFLICIATLVAIFV